MTTKGNYDVVLAEMDEQQILLKKATAFDKIAALFYEKNFGSASKSEVELLMFSIYLDAMVDMHTHNDILDYNACSDYIISKALGIPQGQVRNLKVKKQARHPRDFDWRKSLESIKNDIVYEEAKKKIIIPLRDPNLYIEIQNFIESNGGYIEIQRGANYIQIRPEYFFILLYKGTENEKEKEKIRKEFAKKLRERNDAMAIDDILTDEELSDRALAIGDDFFEFAKEVAMDLSNPLVAIISAISCLTKVAQKRIR